MATSASRPRFPSLSSAARTSCQVATGLDYAPMRRASAVLLAVLAAPSGAHAAVDVGAGSVTVATGQGSKVVVQRDPLAFTFYGAGGRAVLRSVEAAGDTAAALPLPHSQFGEQNAPPQTLYAPLTFLVGSQRIDQFPSAQWQGDLQSVTEEGMLYHATKVIDAAAEGSGATLTLGTTDPSGRRVALTIAPVGDRG